VGQVGNKFVSLKNFSLKEIGSWGRRRMRSRRMGFRDQEEESCACEFS